jgi:hypothetical protein
MVERRKKKLACFQKTRSRVVKKGDTTKASVPVNSLFTLEELIHMIDVSINMKYGRIWRGLRALLLTVCGDRWNLLGRSSNMNMKIYLCRSGLLFIKS